MIVGQVAEKTGISGIFREIEDGFWDIRDNDG